MKLEVGMYIRTKEGIIARIKEIDNNERLYLNQKSIYTDDYKHYLIIDYEVIKASYNIIDILEVGDYVNGIKVGYIDDCKGAMREYNYIFEDEKHDVGHYEEEIHSVVTKEQFYSMEYRLGDDK